MGKPIADTRYLDYFAASLSHLQATDPMERQRAARTLLAEVEAGLNGGGHAPDVLARELALARAAAAGAGRPAAAPDSAAPQGAAFKLRPSHLLWLALAFLAYATPLFFFFYGNAEKARPENAGGRDIALEFKVSAVDLARDTVTFHVMPEAGALLAPNGRLAQDITVEIDTGAKPEAHTFKADTPLTPWTLTVNAASGDILEYPFDRYEVDMEVMAKSQGRALSVLSTLNKVPHDIVGVMSEKVLPNGEDSVAVNVRRSGTIIFVALLAALSLLLVTAAACAVAFQVHFRGRKADFSMMTWVAALSFVIPSVRNALPGAAPTGALIDFLLFFWLQIAAGLAMAVMVMNWIRQKPA